jgi:hypothetical protein
VNRAAPVSQIVGRQASQQRATLLKAPDGSRPADRERLVESQRQSDTRYKPDCQRVTVIVLKQLTAKIE